MKWMVSEPRAPKSAVAVDIGDDRHGLGEGAGQDELAGLEGHALFAQHVGQPGQRCYGVAHDVGAGAGSGDLCPSMSSEHSTRTEVRRRSTSSGVVPTAMAPQEALSATVSTSRMSQSAMRESMISMAA